MPTTVAALADGNPVTPVWQNELGGLTFETRCGSDRRFIKWSPTSSGPDLRREAARLRWVGSFTPVPTVIDAGATESGSWLVTEGLPGESAVADRWKASPASAVVAIGAGLRAFHEAVPVESCPFSWRVSDRCSFIRHEALRGRLRPTSRHPDFRRLSIAEILARLDDPPDEDLVVCHGDACAPNTLIAEDGRCSGHVDLGSLGIADRWADLAVATWATNWNYGPGWESLLLRAYHIEPDAERTAFYRLLWTLEP